MTHRRYPREVGTKRGRKITIFTDSSVGIPTQANKNAGNTVMGYMYERGFTDGME